MRNFLIFFFLDLCHFVLKSTKLALSILLSFDVKKSQQFGALQTVEIFYVK